jgi:hypothetical protein
LAGLSRVSVRLDAIRAEEALDDAQPVSRLLEADTVIGKVTNEK